MQGINLRSLFQYKATEVSLVINEIDFSTETIINVNNVGPIKFISGFKPELIQNNCAFLNIYDINRSATALGYVFVNMILTIGNHSFKVLKNNIEVDSFSINVVSTNICSRAFKLSNYAAHKGDVISICMVDNPIIKQDFYILPESFYSNFIAFEDQYRLKTVLEFTGEYNFPVDFVSKINRIQKGAIEAFNKISSKSDVSFIINTGFILEEEEIVIEGLLGSLRAWLITGENQGLEIIANTKKMVRQDPQTALYSYDIEFLVNPKNAKPLYLSMNKPLVILEIDDIAPTAPSNLVSSNTSTTSTVLNWTAATDVSGVSGYDIFKNDVYLGSTINTNYSVSGLVASTTYSFKVKAKDPSGNISNSSNVVSVTTASTIDTTPPTQPTNLVASLVTTNSLRLSWTASTDNVGISRYNVYKNGIKITETTATVFDVNGLFGNTSYSFYVTAQDLAGNVSIASNTVSSTTNANLVSSYYYEGFWEFGDRNHRNGGSVTYVDADGITKTENGFFAGVCKEIIASSIISTDGVDIC